MSGPSPGTGTVPFDARVAIEQAIARRETLDWICDNLRVPTTWVDQTLRIMDAANGIVERPPRASNVTLQPCGTPAAFRRHKRNGEQPCPPCREAANAYDRELSRRRRVVADAPEYDRLIAAGVSAHIAATLARGTVVRRRTAERAA